MANMESPGGEVRYGTRGPDKYSFLIEGVWDSKAGRDDSRSHLFVINGEEVLIYISEGRPIPTWQCPPHPDIPKERHDYDWGDAWEFRGVAENGSHVLGIYSPRSRRGVFHFWPIALAGHKNCDGCKHDLQQFFAAQTNSEAMLSLIRAMRHMTRGSAIGGYHVDCEDCWKRFQELRRFRAVPF